MLIRPSAKSIGATITGIKLSEPTSKDASAVIRDAWLKYRVISFPDQSLDNEQLVKFSLSLGNFGEDPFIQPIEG